MADMSTIAQSLASQPEMRSYEPSWRDRIAYALSDAAGAFGAGRYAQQDIASGVRNVVDFIPIVGDAVGINDAYRDYQSGNYGQAAAGLGLAAVGAIPGVGDVVAGAARRTVKDTAEELANMLRKEGANIGEITNWGSNAGQSSYFTPSFEDAMGFRRTLPEFRVSDHDVGPKRYMEHSHIRPNDDLSLKIEEIRKMKEKWDADLAEPMRMYQEVVSSPDLLMTMSVSPRDIGKAWSIYKQSGGQGKFQDFQTAFRKIKDSF